MPEPIDTENEEVPEPVEEPTPSPFLENVADKVDEDELKRIGHAVVEDYKTDVGSREGWNKQVEGGYKLFTGVTEKKTIPWENSSNVNIPLLSVACLQFASRAVEALLPPKEIAKCFATDGKAINEAARCQKFMNWQLTDQMEEWEEDMDVLLLLLPIFGVAVKKTYYDPALKRNVSITLRMDEFVAPYGVTRLEDAPRKTHVYKVQLNDIRIKGRDGIWIDIEGIKNTTPSYQGTDGLAEEYKEISDKATGTSDSLEDKDQPRMILEQHRTWDIDGDGIEEPYIITVDKETEKVLRIESLTYKDPLTGVDKSYEYFTAYNFIPNPDSWMGFGFSRLLSQLNHAANSLLNQLIDAGTLSNNICGFVNRRTGIKTGELSMDMGEFTAVDASTDDISKSIYQFKFNPPSQVLFVALEMIQGYARELSSVSEAMLGKLPPSDTTATTMLAVMEQGMKVFSTIHKRIHRTFKKELKKLAHLNSIYLDEEVYFAVQDSTSSEMRSFQTGKLDFLNTVDVIPISDPSITSRAEKLIRSKQARELGASDPNIANDPESMYYLTKGVLEALEVPNIDQILKKPEPPPPPPDLRPEEEEAEFLAERDVKPLPPQDHMQHLQSHQAFEGSEWAAQLTPQGKKLLEGHIRETFALAYMQQKQQAAEEENIRNEAVARGVG